MAFRQFAYLAAAYFCWLHSQCASLQSRRQSIPLLDLNLTHLPLPSPSPVAAAETAAAVGRPPGILWVPRPVKHYFDPHLSAQTPVELSKIGVHRVVSAYTCPLCGMPTDSFSVLKQHIRKHMNTEMSESQTRQVVSV